MSTYISKAFSDLGIVLTNDHVRKLERAIATFETRKDHALALNSQMLGVYPIAFTSSDRSFLFELVGIKEKDLVRIVENIPSIDTDHRVVSDAFNLLCVWLIHAAYLFLNNKRARESFQLNIAKYMHYRFFTSIVNYYFSHGASEPVMMATINQLSGKFDIVTYGTWKATLEARSQDLLSEKSIHRNAFLNMDDDEGVKRVITDTQTRMRDKIKNVARIYYDNKDNNARIDSKSMVKDSEDEGKYLSQTSSTIDAMISTVTSDLMNKNRWIHASTVSAVAKQFKSVSQTMLKTTLEDMSATATSQVKRRTVDHVEKTRDGYRYHGIRVLVAQIIRTTYRYIVINRISMNNRVVLYNKIHSAYASSRISDKNINDVKTSMSLMLDDMNKTSRETTKSSLRLAIIMYIVLKTFRHL